MIHTRLKNQISAVFLFGIMFFLGSQRVYAYTNNSPELLKLQSFDISFTVDSGDVSNCLDNDPSADTLYIMGQKPDYSLDTLVSEPLTAGQTIAYTPPLGVSSYVSFIFTCGYTDNQFVVQMYTYTIFRDDNTTYIRDTFDIENAATSSGGTTTEATSTVQLTDNPNEDIFGGILVFFLAMFGVMWIFKKR